MKKLTPIQVLNQMDQQALYQKYPTTPKEYLVIKPNTAGNANSLTKSIIKFLKLSGHQAERISVEGRVIDQRETYTDVLGHRRTIGSIKRVKSSATKGSADISATIKGRSVKIEVKWGRDKQSDNQKAYQAEVERAGGVYMIARTFDQFYEWYNEFVSSI